MNLTLVDLQREAAATGFLQETLEKAVRLLSLLDGLRSHPFLNTRIALKGGTALNLFAFDVPRYLITPEERSQGMEDHARALRR